MARTREEGMEIRIIEAAMAVFGERGFQATTLKDIATGAGISTGSIYTYFADKESLFQAAVSYGWDRFSAELAVLADSDASREQRLAALLDKGFAALTQALPLLRGMLFDASRHNLVEPGMERVTSAIDRLLTPDEEEEGGPGRVFAAKARQSLIKILVTGILFSAALGAPDQSPEALENFRYAVISFLRLVERSWKQKEALLAAGLDPED
ncbi:MAG TPA: helix-turn-helix domain-containing protein [Rectinemataceae bacterium]|nr:helix-turn-helix domain-containing protein [Rectinemataceae bacterium]